MKKIYLLIFLIGVLVVAGCSSNQPTNTQAVQDKQNSVSDKKANTIEMTSSGFSPNELKIKQGDKVTWANKDKVGHWPASAVHPTHEKYPGSSITKCNTPEQSGIFDACKNVNPSESWSFTFNEKGTWFYHDHSNAKLFGKIIVE